VRRVNRAIELRIKRIYEPPAVDDGARVLVDRLWPRGVRKQDAAVMRWLKEVAPSPELRKWFNHDPARLQEFGRRYRAELAHNSAVDQLDELLKNGPVTLLYAARDPVCNHARVLADYLIRHLHDDDQQPGG
jgi:uncharacterized protein YeaO (DUF488 family)